MYGGYGGGGALIFGFFIGQALSDETVEQIFQRPYKFPDLSRTPNMDSLRKWPNSAANYQKLKKLSLGKARLVQPWTYIWTFRGTDGQGRNL